MSAPMSDGDHPPIVMPCTDCASGLELADGQLTCVNVQCSSAWITVPIWRAHERLVAAGLDVPAPGAGWPRPLFDGVPHPYLTPVVAGRAWWKLVDERRHQECQLRWACQVCGSPLPSAAWVVVNIHYEVLISTAMHERCLRLATARCPNLVSPPVILTPLQVTPREIRADHRPLDEVLAAAVSKPATTGDWIQEWTVPRTHGLHSPW
ncbi:hypothetical protein [Umezawaea sp. Da 62-37]|uniref:hypothetical protein n=1 Tax=Umezawaea sp. Da 62-37 TaxID=3075927 RepID=UPI0028F71936|nr:hypothetical protein [Umezawaea sp. Da 62-37]WNV84931.1 hypothetical protein RM788_43380 [Umezawaea sp. Da 62-37]